MLPIVQQLLSRSLVKTNPRGRIDRHVGTCAKQIRHDYRNPFNGGTSSARVCVYAAAIQFEHRNLERIKRHGYRKPVRFSRLSRGAPVSNKSLPDFRVFLRNFLVIPPDVIPNLRPPEIPPNLRISCNSQDLVPGTRRRDKITM